MGKALTLDQSMTTSASRRTTAADLALIADFAGLMAILQTLGVMLAGSSPERNWCPSLVSNVLPPCWNIR